jgi:hypothetical protein
MKYKQAPKRAYDSVPNQVLFNILLECDISVLIDAVNISTNFNGAESFSRSQQLCNYSEVPNILYNQKVHYCVHKNLPLVPILR